MLADIGGDWVVVVFHSVLLAEVEVDNWDGAEGSVEVVASLVLHDDLWVDEDNWGDGEVARTQGKGDLM